MSAATTGTGTARIQVHLRELAQLFNSMDPSPFRERDLDGEAEQFILGWAREHPKDHAFELTIELEQTPPPDRAAGVEEAIQHYFAERAATKQREFRQLMRRGRVSLLVGLVFLVACFSLGEIVAKIGYGTAGQLIRESLMIGGWVAMWRPLEIYLYDWWPLRDQRRLLERLARLKVRLILPGIKSS
jgi:hypothetical protein